MSKQRKGKGGKQGNRPLPQQLARPVQLAGDGDQVDGGAAGYADELIAEAERRLPAGAPVLMEFHQLDRRRRAQYVAALQAIQPKAAKFDSEHRDRLAKLADATAAGGEVDAGVLEASADMFTFLADVEDVLRLVAFDQVAFDRWVRDPRTSDQDLLALFARLSRSMRMGEASSSST